MTPSNPSREIIIAFSSEIFKETARELQQPDTRHDFSFSTKLRGMREREIEESGGYFVYRIDEKCKRADEDRRAFNGNLRGWEWAC